MIPPTWRGHEVSVLSEPIAQRVSPAGEADSTPHAVRVVDAPIGSTVEVNGWPAPQMSGQAPPTFALTSGLSGSATVRLVAPNGEVREWKGTVPPAGLITLRYGEMQVISRPPMTFPTSWVSMGKKNSTSATPPPITLQFSGFPAKTTLLIKGAPCKAIP